MQTATGLDVLAHDGFRQLLGKNIGIVCNQSTVTHDFVHIIDVLLPLHQAGKLTIKSVFGPEHGLFGHTQDNMIEWEGIADKRTGLIINSLYGEHREPTPAMLEGIDLMVVDIPDIGSRYYTFAWTMALTMKACAPLGIPVLVLDRPNPINGAVIEGTLLKEGFESFVGLYQVPTRHGFTAAEIATYVKNRFIPNSDLSTVLLKGWSRSDYFDETDAPWVMPSPNMPTLDTAIVYPGACLLEGTNLSEGRGTTRPFEMVGAPFLDGWKLADALNNLSLPGVIFRPMQFEPTFNKHALTLCEGIFVHVTERRAFESVITYIAIMQEIIRQVGIKDSSSAKRENVFKPDSEETTYKAFAWRQPPYEYEHNTMPIHMLAGNDWLNKDIENLTSLAEIRERLLAECSDFGTYRQEALLYHND